MVRVRLDTRLRTVVMQWFRYDDAAVRPALECELELVRRHGLRSVIVDSQDAVGSYSPAINAWIGHDFLPRMQDTDMRLLISVVPRSDLVAMSNQKWQDGGQASGLRIVEVGSMAEAEQLARQAMDAAAA